MFIEPLQILRTKKWDSANSRTKNRVFFEKLRAAMRSVFRNPRIPEKYAIVAFGKIGRERENAEKTMFFGKQNRIPRKYSRARRPSAKLGVPKQYRKTIGNHSREKTA
jgi:hypothetical protein